MVRGGVALDHVLNCGCISLAGVAKCKRQCVHAVVRTKMGPAASGGVVPRVGNIAAHSGFRSGGESYGIKP